MQNGNDPATHSGGVQWSDEDAQWYIRNYGEHPINKMTAERANLKPADWVLDIGCGSGSALRAAVATVTEGALIGTDPSPVMVRAAREKSAGLPGADRMRFLEGVAEDLPLARNLVSVVWAINSLHHWADIHRGLAEVSRVLKSGGRFLVVEEIFEEHDRGMDAGEVRQVLEEAGFEILSQGIVETPDSSMDYFEARRGDDQ